MTWIDWFFTGFVLNLILLPFIAIRYDLLKVRTTLQTDFSTKKLNEFIAYNIVFSLASFVTDILLITHMAHRKYMQYLTEKYSVTHVSESDVPQITHAYDPTGVSKKKRR